MIILRLLFRTIELLWNLLEHGDEEQVSDQLNSRVTMRFVNEKRFDFSWYLYLYLVFYKKHFLVK